MKKLLLVSLCFLVLCITQVFAQNRTVTGTVTAKDDGLPIPGVTVKIKGTNIGTPTDVNGKFSLSAPSNAVLDFSFIGYETQSVPVRSGSMNVVLSVSSRQLSEIVVTTALGIQRKADNLNYAQQGISGNDLTSTRITDVNQALAGKISNVQVRTQSSAKLGSQSQVRIRGGNSVSNISNDPLYVVDGTPLDDINYINMDDVDDLQVLKGPAAAALYGVRAANGVIMITTKKAKSRVLGINFVSTYSIDKVGVLPKYQNLYSGGSAGAGPQTYTYKPGVDPVEWAALNGKTYHTYGDDASWGLPMNGQEYIPWYAWYPGTPYSFKTAKLTPQPNNIRDFYNTGTNAQNNISLAKAGEDYNVRLSYTNQLQAGLIPNTNLKRNYFQSQMSYNLNSHFTVDANINYVNQKTQGDFNDDYGNTTSGSFNQWFHRDVDMGIVKELQDLRTPTGHITGWNLDDSAGPNAANFYHGSAYWWNPYTYVNGISAVNIQDRLYGSMGFTYKLNSHWKINATARHNQRNTHYESKLPTIFEVSVVDGDSPLANNQNGAVRPATATYRTYDVRQIENNYEFLGSYNQKFGQFTVDGNIGGNIRQNVYSSLDNSTKGGLVVPDLFTLSNSKVTPFTFSNTRTYKVVRSLYGRGSVNWNDIATVDFSLRNDWSSALPANSNSYLYPSIGASFVFTKFTEKALPWLSFGKVRGTFAEVGSDLDPYQLGLLYSVGANQFASGGVSNITMTTPNTLTDPNIVAALSKSIEFGLDLRFLNDRLGFSGTYYNENRTKDIISVTVAGASGYTTKLINAGKINRHGIELTVDGYPVKTRNFSWNILTNFAQNRSQIVELLPDHSLKNLYVNGGSYSSASGAANYAPGVWSIEGGEYGQLRGRGIAKNDAGVNIIDPATGYYVYQDNVTFGSILPKFTGGIVNTFNYKGVALNFAIDFQSGGKYYSLSDQWGSVSGLLDYTAAINDKGKNVRDAVSAGGGVHVTGVTAAGAPVDKYVDAIDYYVNQYSNKINELHVFDLGYVKLREVNLGYTLPVKTMGPFFNSVKSLQLSVFARNPWLIYAKNRNFDPSELTGNYGEAGQMPPSKTYGLTLKFGF
jgi:TonB-linked SusC/RagA family outer membrane protein